MRPRRHHHSLLPPGLSIERIEIGGTEIVAVARTRLTIPECPACGRTSTRIHSRYGRCLADLPTHGLRVRISLEVRRFRCGPELPENDIRRAVRRRDHAIACPPHLTAAERRPPSRSLPWRHQAHNLKVRGSNPLPATNENRLGTSPGRFTFVSCPKARIAPSSP